jgi:hypothetical protein
VRLIRAPRFQREHQTAAKPHKKGANRTERATKQGIIFEHKQFSKKCNAKFNERGNKNEQVL